MFMTTGHGPYIINKFMSRLLNMAKIFMDLTYIRPVNMTSPYKNMEDQRLYHGPGDLYYACPGPKDMNSIHVNME